MLLPLVENSTSGDDLILLLQNLSSFLIPDLVGDDIPQDKVESLNILRIEHDLYADSNTTTEQIDIALKDLLGLARMPMSARVIKYHDLVTDYQYLFQSRSFNAMDLVQKKLNLLSSIEAATPLFENILEKTVFLFLVAGADYRRQNVLDTLASKQLIAACRCQSLRHLLELSLRNSILPRDFVTGLAEELSSNIFVKYVLNEYRHTIQLRIDEANISMLPKFYSSITYLRIQLLLQFPGDVENLVFEMVSLKKLPEGTKIDQVRQLVVFPLEPLLYDILNTHTKKVLSVVDELSSG